MSEKTVTIVELNQKPEYQRLLAGWPQTYGVKAGRVHLNPDEDCGWHSTEHREELLVFLTGQGQLLIGESNSFQIGKGKVAYIPPNTTHNVKNTGQEPLIYIYCVSPVTELLDEKQGN